MSDPWSFSCSLNLASCRQRAESLARQWHTSLWSPRSSLSSDGGSRSVSPCLGLYSPATLPLIVVDRPSKLFDRRMSSLDGEDEEYEAADDKSSVDVVVTPPTHLSPPQSPDALASNGEDLYANYKRDAPVWMPDSPPESFGSESLQSDSPALTVEMEERSSVSSGTETVSEIASPTDDLTCIEKGSALADELCNRLRQFESLQVNGRSVPSPQDDLTDMDNQSNSTSDSPKQDSNLLSPEPCPRLVRSTSLKTGKTPPDTPNRKKIVRFADALGLDLEAVRHFVDDEDAAVPPSAFADLKTAPSEKPISLPWAALPGQAVTCHFVPQFQQPAADPQFLDKIRQQKVSLENIMVNDLKLTAVVRVLNLGFEKQLCVRYTTTEWAAYTDLTADYVPQSCDGFSDKFTFQIHLPHLCSGQRLIFALKYVANGRQEFWDNNSGSNYVLRVQNKPNDSMDAATGTVPRWWHHFM